MYVRGRSARVTLDPGKRCRGHRFRETDAWRTGDPPGRSACFRSYSGPSWYAEGTRYDDNVNDNGAKVARAFPTVTENNIFPAFTGGYY